jgi:hypothetical protein
VSLYLAWPTSNTVRPSFLLQNSYSDNRWNQLAAWQKVISVIFNICCSFRISTRTLNVKWTHITANRTQICGTDIRWTNLKNHDHLYARCWYRTFQQFCTVGVQHRSAFRTQYPCDKRSSAKTETSSVHATSYPSAVRGSAMPWWREPPEHVVVVVVPISNLQHQDLVILKRTFLRRLTHGCNLPFWV